MRSNSTRSPFRPRPTARRAGFPGLRVEGAAADEAKMMLYDEIGFFGVTAKDFIAEFDAISARTIHLHINSPGGDVFEGLAIANAIRDSSARVVTHVDALAASIASVIALAGDYVRMQDNAFLMIHNPYMLAIGNAADLRKGADLLDKIAGSIIGEYTKKSGQSTDQVTAWMDAETWFTADEAEAEGLVDAVDNADDATADTAAAALAAFDLSLYEHAPAALARDARERHGLHEPAPKDLERALREAGLTRAEAKAVLARGLNPERPTPPAGSATDPDPRDAEERADIITAGQTLLKTLTG